MIDLDGIPYKKRQPAEIVSDMADYINNYCSANNVRDKEGELVYIEKNMANLAYLLLYGMAYEGSIMENYIYSLGRGLNIPSASPLQVLELAAMAGLRRKQPINTIVPVLVGVRSGADQPVSITTLLTITYSQGGNTVVFSPTNPQTIAPGTTRIVYVRADKPGAISVPSKAFSGFDQASGDPALASINVFENGPSTPGRQMETVEQLRVRLQQRGQPTTRFRRAADAVEALEGVAACNIYFNHEASVSVNIGGMILPPRMATAFIQGYNENIAATIFSYINAPFFQPPPETGIVYTSQGTKLTNGQSVYAHWVPPVYVTVLSKIYVRGSVDAIMIKRIQAAVVKVMLQKGIGDAISAVDLIKCVIADGLSVDITGASIGLSQLEMNSLVELNANELGDFTTDNVFVEVAS
jgi:hypothetical protein